MPGKSRREQARRSVQRQQRRSALAGASQRQVPANESVPLAHSSGVPKPVAKPTGIRYPYINTELRKIGIMAGVGLAILIVLALALP